ncbi:DUF6479 family protein [Streptomyces rubiginosohelvolus]
MDAPTRGTARGSLIAAPEWAAGTVPFIVGLLVVALLIGAVVWRTRSGRGRQSRPQEQPPAPRDRAMPPRSLALPTISAAQANGSRPTR